MAKALKKPQPRSSVDRFFSAASLDEALAPQAIRQGMGSGTEDEPPPTEAAIPETPPMPATEAAASQEAAREKPPEAAPAGVGDRIAGIIAQRAARPTITVVAPQPEAPATRTFEPVDRQREFQLTRSADETLEDLILVYRRATGAEVTRSHVLRAVLKAVSGRMPALKAAASGIGPLRRPSNAKGFEEAREEFENRIAAAFLEGMAGR